MKAYDVNQGCADDDFSSYEFANFHAKNDSHLAKNGQYLFRGCVVKLPFTNHVKKEAGRMVGTPILKLTDLVSDWGKPSGASKPPTIKHFF